MNRGHRLAVAWQIFLEAGLLLVLPLIFYRPFTEQFSTPKIVLTELLVAAGLAVSALTLIWRRAPRPRLRFGLPLALLTGAVLLSCMNSPSPGFSLERAGYVLCGPAWLLILILSPKSGERICRLSVMAAAAGTVVAVVTLAQWLGRDPLLFGGVRLESEGMVERMHLYSTLGNPNFVAGYLVGAVFLAVTLGWTESRRLGKVAWFTASGAMLAAIVATQSHGAWGALVIGLIVGWWPARERKAAETSHPFITTGATRRPAPQSPAVLVPPYVWLAVPMFTDLPARLLSQLQGRVYLWRVGWPLFAQHPLLGSGWGAIQLRSLELQAQFLAAHPDQLSHWSNISQLHNDPLQLLLEAGALGLGAFLWLGWDYAQELRQALARSDRPALLYLAAGAGGGVAILVDSVFNFQFAIPPTFILLFTLVAFPALLRSPKETDRSHSPASARSASIRIIMSLAVLSCAAFLLSQTVRHARAEIDYAQRPHPFWLGPGPLSGTAIARCAGRNRSDGPHLRRFAPRSAERQDSGRDGSERRGPRHLPSRVGARSHAEVRPGGY